MFTNILSFFFFFSSIFHQASSLPTRTLHKRIPAAVYGAGHFALKAQGTPIVILDNGISVSFQDSDSNLVVYDNGIAKWQSQVTEPAGCLTNSCFLSFQPDGNFVSYFNDVPTFFTGTGSGQGAWLVFFDIEPYIVIYNAAFQPIWHTPITPPVLPAKPPAPPAVKPPAASPATSSSAPTPVQVHIVSSAAHPVPSPVAPPAISSASPPNTSPAASPNTPSAALPSTDPFVIHVPQGDGDKTGSIPPADPFDIPVPQPNAPSSSVDGNTGNSGSSGVGDDSGFNGLFGVGDDSGLNDLFGFR